MLLWKINPMEELKSSGMNSNQIRKSKLFGQSTLQKMRHGKLVSWAEFDRLCGVLHKQPGDLLAWVPDGEQEELPEEKPAPSNWYKPNDAYGQSGAEK